MNKIELETIEFVNKGDVDFDTKKQPINASNLNQMQTNTNNALSSIQDKMSDTEYIDAELTDDFELYNDTVKCQYRKIGNFVEFFGQLKPKAEISASAQSTIMFYLPENFSPKTNRYFVGQGSSLNKYLVTVFSNGGVGISRYGTSTSSAIPTTSWLAFNGVFLVDDTLNDSQTNTNDSSSETQNNMLYFTEGETISTYKVLSNLLGNNSKINASEIAVVNDNTAETLDNYLNNILPVVLYDNSNGSNETITLNDSAENYSYIEIFFKSNDSFYNSVKVFEPNNKDVFLASAWINYSGNSSMKLKVVTINGTSIGSSSDARYGGFGIGGNTAKENTDSIYITRVVGYK